MRLLAMLALVFAACAAPQRSRDRLLLTDAVQFGSSPIAVEAWHLAHQWCKGRSTGTTDRYFVCKTRHPRGVRPRALFRFTDHGLEIMAVYVPVDCGRDCHNAYDDDDPFTDDDGLAVDPIAVGRSITPPNYVDKPQRRTLDDMMHELVERYGAPMWQNAERTAMTWARENEEVGLFLWAETNWVIEVHVAASPAPGKPH